MNTNFVKAFAIAGLFTAAVSAPAMADGEAVYNKTCKLCHSAGIAGAPKTGDKAAWSARLAGGIDAMYTSALKGKKAMPAKGGNKKLSDDEVKSAVDFMIAKSK